MSSYYSLIALLHLAEEAPVLDMMYLGGASLLWTFWIDVLKKAS